VAGFVGLDCSGINPTAERKNTKNPDVRQCTFVGRRVSLQANVHSRILANAMQNGIRYTYWQHDSMWLGYLEEFPDYWTQGENLGELQENLKDLYQELTSGSIPEVRRVAKLQVS
jgi:predicted RNase H-like HicB family nuclease